MAVFNRWSDYQLYGWALESVEEFRDYVNSQGYNFDNIVEQYKKGVYNEQLSPLFDKGGVNFNLGGENDKSKLEFTDRPIGVFDFSLASQQLFRVHEFYSEQLKNEKPNLFESYNVPAGVVPNYYVKRITVQGVNNFVYEDSESKQYLCIRRQKGLTKLLEQQPSLKTKIQEGTGLIIPELPTNKVKFASKTKKPYLKYKKQGGKVRYVEMYSAHYYTRMSGDFSFAVRHIPMIMAAEYLEKMGTLTKLYVTRFVIPTSQTAKPKKKDVLTNIDLPLFSEWKSRNEPRNVYLIMPMCVKEYGQEINKPAFFAVGSANYSAPYDLAVANTRYHEVDSGNLSAYGDPDWAEKEYQEGFERFRQKYYMYADKGIWKAKEIVPQGLIYFHDLVLNYKFRSFYNTIESIFSDRIDKLIVSNVSVNKWFEMWMKISALTIKDKFDIFNTNKVVKVYKEIIKQQEIILQEIELMIRLEQNDDFKNVLKDFLGIVKDSTIYNSSGNAVSVGYSYGNTIKYITEKIDEMTVFGQNGIFKTPEDQIEKRTEIAERLYEELTKI
jgi:hypothetical protein